MTFGQRSQVPTGQDSYTLLYTFWREPAIAGYSCKIIVIHKVKVD